MTRAEQHRAQRRRHLVLIRKRVAAVSVIVFIALFSIIYVQMAAGRDPVLGSHKTTASAKHGTSSSSSNRASTSQQGTSTPQQQGTSTTQQGTTSSQQNTTSSPPAVTTSQS